ncbi:hypothetical protein KCU98_g3463, partial [Aureobasidium melanogenum]
MKLNSIALVSILAATVLATPIPDAAAAGYGSYGNYGKYGNYGNYGSYSRDAEAEALEKRAALPSYGNYGNYGNYGKYGSYGSYPPQEKRAAPGAGLPSYGTYGDYGSYPEPKPNVPATAGAGLPSYSDYGSYVDFENGELYNYTSRRFLINEKDELAKRRVRFDVNALGARAAKTAAPEGTTAVNIEKVHEGIYTKTYVIRFSNGVKLMAKIFNPDEHHSIVSTLSEIRTAKFAHIFTAVPAFRHTDLAIKAEDNDVAAPFVLTLAPKGVPLSSVWSDMNPLEQQGTMHAVMTYITRWSNFKYPGYGDVSSRDRRTTSLTIDVDAAAGKAKRYSAGRDDTLLRPAPWKRNITADTIYVDPDSSYRIKGILDWRYAEVAPAYRQVNQPAFIMYGDAGSSSAPETVHDIYVRLVSGRPMTHIVQALRFKKTTEYWLLESAHDIIKDNGISFLTRAIEYIQTERHDIAEMLEDDPELSITKLSKKFEPQIAFHRRKDYLMQKVRAELGDLVAEDWTVRPD